MTALKPREVEGFLDAPDDKVILALIYGPEQGLVRERAERLAKQVAEDLLDPWRVVSFTEQEAGEPGRLTDEAAAQSFLGGKRVIRVRGSGAGVASAVGSLLKASNAGTLHAAALVIVEAGDLKKSAGLRKAVEAAPDAAAIPCYPEGVRDTIKTLRRQFADEGLSLDDAAAELLAVTLGDDRGVMRQEAEKLILYVGPRAVRGEAPYTVTADDVAACLADAPQDDSFSVASLALSGQAKGLSHALAEAEAAGQSVIALLRLAQNRIMRLLPAAEAMAKGEGPGAAIKKIKPPVFFKEQAEVERQLQAWPLHRLERASAALYEAEAACKHTGAPQQAIAERVLLSLAAAKS